MGFYYPSIISLSLLMLFYIIGTVVLLKIWKRCREGERRALKTVPLFLLLYLAPVAEELWIAWNFGQSCKKDAGIFINKIVEVDGFYDDTRATTPVPRTKQAADDLDRGGYRFYEMVYRDLRGGPNKVVRLEKIDGVWAPATLDRPTAKYHYSRDQYGIPTSHKINRQEARVIDSVSGEVVGKYMAYSRGPHWFFIGLAAPRMSCDGPDMGPNTKHSSLIYEQVLKPSPRS